MSIEPSESLEILCDEKEKNRSFQKGAGVAPQAIGGYDQLAVASAGGNDGSIVKSISDPAFAREKSNQTARPMSPRQAAFDEKAEQIIQEARNALPSLMEQCEINDERKERIIEEARKGSVDTQRRFHTTNEVLQLVGKVFPLNSHQDDEDNEVGDRRLEDSVMNGEITSAISDGGTSVDSYDKAVRRLPLSAASSDINHQAMLNKIDGIDGPSAVNKRVEENSYDPFNLLNYFLGTKTTKKKSDGRRVLPTSAHQETEEKKIADDASQISVPVIPPILSHSNSFLTTGQKSTEATPLFSYSEKINANEVDARMPVWISQQQYASTTTIETSKENLREEEEGQESRQDDKCVGDISYSLGTSRSVIVHEVVRGNWTWCTAWSPDGNRLAVGTETHHLAVIETAASTVWKVKHDKRITAPVKNDTTHSIRSIAWGSQFIAIGGTGNAVSILAPSEPYPIIHTIKETGFVGSIDWKVESTLLAIGSRDDKCLIVNVTTKNDVTRGRHIESTVEHTISRKDWVNVVRFSPGGNFLAVGDRSGLLSLYNHIAKYNTNSEISNIANFMMDDSVLAIEWSPDGKWLYAGGEDFRLTVIETSTWQVIHRIERDRWVQFIASSHTGSHVAIGGVESEVTILDATKQWKPVMRVELKGLVPLSAQWHPKDQFLVLTGQDNNILAIETTDARLVKGFFLSSISPVIDVEFSPDCCFAAVGNEAGLVSFYSLLGSTFVTSYEMILTSGPSRAIRWSPNGHFVLVGCGKTLVIIGKTSIDNGHTNVDRDLPPNTAGFSVRRVIRGLIYSNCISIDRESKYVAVGGQGTRILDATSSFCCVKEWKSGKIITNEWAPDRTLLATVGLRPPPIERSQPTARRKQNDKVSNEASPGNELRIYDTSNESIDEWRLSFSIQMTEKCMALSWAPVHLDGLQYLAYGGENKKVTIIEIRTIEETWEVVLEVSRDGVIHELDWNNDGLLAVAIGDGTVTIIDLAYLQSGTPLNEMDYNWQRQGLTCFKEIRRHKGKNSTRTVRWMPSRPGDDNYLAIGGTDGNLELVDLTHRHRCKGFENRI